MSSPKEVTYHIEDEPRPGALAHLVVNPLWPLFGVMFAGPGWGWGWSVLNGFAVGSPTRRKELAWVLAGLAGSAGLILLLGTLAGREILSEAGLQYSLVGLTVWKLAVSYWVFTLQSRSFRLYEYFGGQVRNGMLGVFAGFFIAPKIYSALPKLLQLVLSNF